MLKILFICTTNHIRSPLAEHLFKKLTRESGVQEQFEVSSAGTYPGDKPRGVDKKMAALALSAGVDISAHRTIEVSKVDLHKQDCIIALDRDSFDNIRLNHKFGERPVLRLFLEYSPQMGTRVVPDPILDGVSYEECFKIINDTIPHLFRSLGEGRL